MPTCPMCGEDFRKGGTFTTHVQSCDAAPDEPAKGGEEAELNRLRQRVNRLEEQLVQTPSQEEVETLWSAVMDPNSRLPSNSRLRDYEDALERLGEVESRLERLIENRVAECPACEERILAPDASGRHECPECGTEIEWSEEEIPPKGKESARVLGLLSER